MENQIKKYVVGFIFDRTMENVLLLKRNKNPYDGLLNGIGGKIESEETPEEAVIRELAEETRIIPNEIDKMGLLCTSFYPSGVELHAFYIVLYREPNLSIIETDEGVLYWLNIKENDLLNAANSTLAGEGNVSYFINYARILNNVH